MKAPILHGENREFRHLLSSITTLFSPQRYGIPVPFLGGCPQKQREKQQRYHQHALPSQADEFPTSVGRPRRRAAAQTTGSSTSTMDTTTMIHSNNNNNNCFTNLATQQTLHRCQDSNPDTSQDSLECLHSDVLDSSLHRDHPPPRVLGLAGFLSGGYSTIHENGSQQPSPSPSLSVISFEFLMICNIYIKYAARFFKQHFQRIRRIVIYFVGFVLTAAALVVALCALDFYRNATRLCTPAHQAEVYDSVDRHLFAASTNRPNPNFRPLVEYFVHGRGMGHYARSVVIVEELNKAGVDVRQFIAKTATRNALHDEESSNNLVDDEEANPKNQPQLGTTRTIYVASITPSLNLFSAVSRTMERVLRDCEVAANSNRHPSLIISDGDMPGMLRAFFGGIPSISISHGQLFRIARKPSWINNDRALNRSWNKQGRLNGLASYFSNWQIATHFCFLESKLANGVVAQAPLRAEVLTMAQTRKMAHRGQFQSDSQSMPQLELVKYLLLIESTPDLQHLVDRNDQEATTTASKKKMLIPPAKRRKVVICYFRDCNGGAVVDVLLASDFDVLIFDTCNITDPQTDRNRYVTQATYLDAQAQPHGNTVKGNTANSKNSSQHSPVVSSENSEDADSEHWKRLGDIMDNNVNNSDDHPRLIRVADRSLFVPLMHVADGVASSAGSQLMSECIYSEMPLLAMYLEHDDEQRMNVELSSHSAHCPTKPQVYGTSFEFLNSAADGKSDQLRRRSNHNVTRANAAEGLHRKLWGGRPRGRNSESDHARQEIGRFVMAVRGSPVSEAFYENSAPIMTREAPAADDTTITDSTTTDEGEKGVEGRLPDAAVIIFEILKKVEMAG